jgi:hypothetical protein
MAALDGDKEINMEDVAASNKEDEHFPQESQVPSYDIYICNTTTRTTQQGI